MPKGLTKRRLCLASTLARRLKSGLEADPAPCRRRHWYTPGMRGGKVIRLLSVVAAVVALMTLAIVADQSGEYAWAIGTIGVVGLAVISGVSRSAWERAPWVLAGILVLGYLGLVGWMGIHTARCPSCDAGDGDRVYYFWLDSIVATFLAVWALGCVLVGASVSSLWQGRHRPT